MYRVVIIDDEPIILEGLKKVVSWAEYGCEVVGTAENGEAGTRLIREQKPDILFSDIAMPGMDGLTMAAGLKSEFPDMEICILTGYRDFDYAQRAIRLGVCRFLLKPSNMKEIEEALQAMGKKLGRKQRSGGGLRTTETGEAGIGEAGTGVIGTGGPGTEEVGRTDRDSGGRPEEVKEAGTGGERAENGEAGSELSEASSFIVKNALKFIQANYNRKLTLSEVAEKTFVSQWHLSKLLNKQLGQNFSEILNHVRLEEAKKLLRDPALRIGDVAEMVGFLDLAHFSRVFKKTAGISANEYRNKISMREIEGTEEPQEEERR